MEYNLSLTTQVPFENLRLFSKQKDFGQGNLAEFQPTFMAIHDELPAPGLAQNTLTFFGQSNRIKPERNFPSNGQFATGDGMLLEYISFYLKFFNEAGFETAVNPDLYRTVYDRFQQSYVNIAIANTLAFKDVPFLVFRGENNPYAQFGALATEQSQIVNPEDNVYNAIQEAVPMGSGSNTYSGAKTLTHNVYHLPTLPYLGSNMSFQVQLENFAYTGLLPASSLSVKIGCLIQGRGTLATSGGAN